MEGKVVKSFFGCAQDLDAYCYFMACAGYVTFPWKEK